jgi:hypothetical protein
MRSITAIASCALLVRPPVSLNAHERGREDELRRQQAQQDRNAYRPDRDRSRDDRSRDPNVRYDDR